MHGKIEEPGGTNERPYLPEGSGDEESPEEPGDSLGGYEERMWAFERMLDKMGRRPKRRLLSDYTKKNCEEAWGYTA